MIDDAIREKAEKLLTAARARRWRLATVESCTGGLIAGALTAIAGSSDVVEGGFVTYSNGLKMALVGVDAGLLENYGAVSEPVARAMADGGRARAQVDLAIAVTGIAGPGGGSDVKPVGLVFIAVAIPGSTHAREYRFGDIGRSHVRRRSVAAALDLALTAIGSPSGDQDDKDVVAGPAG